MTTPGVRKREVECSTSFFSYFSVFDFVYFLSYEIFMHILYREEIDALLGDYKSLKFLINMGNHLFGEKFEKRKYFLYSYY